jgi:hypothetical protein
LKAEKLIKLPEPWLNREQFPHLNRAFYGAEPHVYFDTRLHVLLVAAGDPDAINDALASGVEYRALKMGGTPLQETEIGDETREERRHNAFVIADSVSLLHHAGETLLRLYFAHAPADTGKVSPCPWIEIARELQHARFKQKVERRFDGSPLTTERARDLATVFYGGFPKEETTGDHFRASLASIEQWLTHFSRAFLDDAHMFNAVKHGLAIQAGASSLQVGIPTDREGEASPLIRADGASIAFLERAGPDDLWSQSTRWVEPDWLMAEVRVACWLLENLWRAARIRYLGDDPRDHQFRYFDHVDLNEFTYKQRGTAAGHFIASKVSMSNLYLWAYPPELVCSRCHRKPRKDEKRPRKSWWGLKTGAPPSIAVICPECADAWRAESSGASRQ